MSDYLPLEIYAVSFLFSGISQLNAVTFLAPGGIFLSSYSFGAAVFFFSVLQFFARAGSSCLRRTVLIRDTMCLFMDIHEHVQLDLDIDVSVYVVVHLCAGHSY